ncbi:hypothetical protein D3C84_1010620 [compost metagenome]
MKRVFIQFMSSIGIGRNIQFFITHIQKFLRIIEHTLALHSVADSRKSTIGTKNHIVFFLFPLPSFGFANMQSRIA